MKNQLLSSFLAVFFLFLFASSFSQDLDLIVTTKGDSIACRIDSITKTHIYFEMKSQNKWAHSHIGLTDVSEYKRSAIDKKKYVFKAGTSIIASQKVIKPIKPVKPVKNAVKTDLFSWPAKVGVLKYERVFSENISVQLGFYYSWDFPSYDSWSGEAFATGFAITPEFRYYLSKKRPAPRGIYLAPNFRYQKLETENLEENSEATVINNSIAINLGYQLVLKDLFLVDAWMGLAYNIINVVEETVPGADIRFNDESGIGPRGGISIGLVF